MGPTSSLRRSLPESTGGTSTSTICSTIHSGTRSWHRTVDVALHGALLDPPLWNGSEGPPGNKRELRLRTTIFAGVLNVAQRITQLPCLQRIRERKSLGLSLSKTVCALSILISLFFVMQSSCCFLWCLGVDSRRRFGNWDIDGRVHVLKQWDIHRSLYLLNHKHLDVGCITTGTSAVFCLRSSVVAAKVFRSSKGTAAIFGC